jgi:2-keto-3-deoxy-L-rhamnonate aldolase RhmA
MTVTENATLKKLKSGQVALGVILKLNIGVEMAKIARASDHDFLFIDLQHNGMSIETASSICTASLDSGVTPLVRVPRQEASIASRLLDNGAMGIIVPDVESAEQAREIVQNCRFAPLGARSVGAGYPQLGYGGYSTSEAARLMNEQIMLVAMIESGRGIENADAIASVPGIDVVHIGSNDLLYEMGISGELGKEKHFALAEKVRDACRAHGKIFGIGGVRAPDLQSRFIAMGARMLTTNSDLAFLLAAMGERAKSMREAEKQARGKA